MWTARFLAIAGRSARVRDFPKCQSTIDDAAEGEILCTSCGSPFHSGDGTTVGWSRSEQHRKLGEWPTSLAALVPKYLKEVPVDPFDGQPFLYRRTFDGVVVYSPGRDRVDDQGKLYRSGDVPKH